MLPLKWYNTEIKERYGTVLKMAEFVFTQDKPGFSNTLLVSENIIEASDAEINSALPTAQPGRAPVRLHPPSPSAVAATAAGRIVADRPVSVGRRLLSSRESRDRRSST